MAVTSQRDLAERLRAFHREPPILVLPNAWDVASALVLASLPQCRALATTSAGVAAALGYADGEEIPRDEMLATVARIAAAVDVPVTADLEAGYGPRPEDAAKTAEQAIIAGAVGLNLEDGTAEPELHAAKVEAAVEAGRSAGVRLVVNARVDVYILALGEPEGRLRETLRRAERYLEAGADCIFVPAVSDRETIGTLAQEIDAPLNVLATAETPPVAELEELGVARVSVGSGLHRATLPLVEHLGRELLERGSFEFLADATPFLDVQALFGAESRP